MEEAVGACMTCQMAAAEPHQLSCTQSPWSTESVRSHVFSSIPRRRAQVTKAKHIILKHPVDRQARKELELCHWILAMEALRGVRNLRSAAARVGQQWRRVSAQSAKYLKENADTTKLSSAEAEQLGAAKKPPGKSDTPGSFMHQQSNLSNKNNKFLQPWLLPIYPMAGMVAIGLGLAAMTAYRELAVNPGVVIDKDKRTEELPEMHEKEWTMERSRRYAQHSPLRKLSTEHKISPFGRHLDDDVKDGPAIELGGKAGSLPGDDNPVHGPGGKGEPLGGNN